MGIFVNSLQLLEGGVRVDLRRTHTLMTEQVLHLLQARTVVQHRSGEGVPQHVRGTLLHRGHLRQVAAYGLVNLRAGDPTPPVRQQQRLRTLHHRLIPHLHIG